MELFHSNQLSSPGDCQKMLDVIFERFFHLLIDRSIQLVAEIDDRNHITISRKRNCNQ